MSVPSTVQTVLNEYIALLNKHLPNELEGIYIHGSIALNAYVDESSDIDFITVTNHRLTEENLEVLSFIHSEIACKYKKPEMDGVYITEEDIGKLYNDDKDYTCKYPFYNNGTVMFDHYFNFNPITWWVFKENGIKILGPEVSTFHIDVHASQLHTYVWNNMNSYWVNRVQTIENSMEQFADIPINIINTEIEWTILGLLRQFYTLKESAIISKAGAGEYGLQHIDEEWHGVIKEAMNIRDNTMQEVLGSNQDRINSVIGFSKYLIGLCNNDLKAIQVVNTK